MREDRVNHTEPDPVEPEPEDDFEASLAPELRAEEEYLRAQVAARRR